MRPTGRPTLRELTAYVYFRDNVAGVQREWWCHRAGCGVWFLAERDTRTNEVLRTELSRPRPRRRRMRLAPQPGERIDRGASSHVHLRGPPGRGLRRRHDRLRAVRGGSARLLAQLQVPPAARAPLLRRALRELP